jgi:hypothetical protein
MQPHEGPGDGPTERERTRERAQTRKLLGVIAILSMTLLIALGWRFL